METIKVKGIVLGSIDYKETSKIVYLFTDVGKISVKALGSKKVKKGLLPFITTMNYVEAIITDSEFPSLIDYSIIDTYSYIKDNLNSELWFSFILEIVSKLPSDIEYSRVYDFLLRILELGKDNNPMLLTIIFMTKILYSFGVNPILKKCIICGSEPSYFSIKNGGALCNIHNISGTYDKKILDYITRIYYFNIYEEDLNTLNDVDLYEIFKVIINYYENHVNIYLKGLNSLIF